MRRGLAGDGTWEVRAGARRALLFVVRIVRAAIVIDHLESVDLFERRAIEIRRQAEALALPTRLTRIYAERTVSSGFEPGCSARTAR